MRFWLAFTPPQYAAFQITPSPKIPHSSDDSLYSIVDGEHLEFVEDASDLSEAVEEFSEAYNLPKAAVRKAFKMLIEGEDDSLYQPVLRGFWREALEVDKVVSYAGTIAPERILAVTPYVEANRATMKGVEQREDDLSPDL